MAQPIEAKHMEQGKNTMEIDTAYGRIEVTVGDRLYMPAYESVEWVEVDAISFRTNNLVCVFKDKGRDGTRLEYVSPKSIIAKQLWTEPTPPEGYEAPVKLRAFRNNAGGDPDNMAFIVSLQRPDETGFTKSVVSMTGRFRKDAAEIYGRIYVTVKDGKLHKVQIVE